MDLLTEGKSIKMQWEAELFRQAMEILKKLAEVNYYKEKARSTKSIGIIQTAIKKLMENDEKDPDIGELKLLLNAVKGIIEESFICLNVLEKSQMESLFSKAKKYEVSNELIETIQILLNEMDPDSFEELQFKISLKLDDKKLLLKRMITKKKREIVNIPNAAEVWNPEKCPILQNPAQWARKSFLGDMIGLIKDSANFYNGQTSQFTKA